jgi:hypothetical protein
MQYYNSAQRLIVDTIYLFDGLVLLTINSIHALFCMEFLIGV